MWQLTSALRNQVEALEKENKQLKGDNEKMVSSSLFRESYTLTAIARAAGQIQGEGELLRLPNVRPLCRLSAIEWPFMTRGEESPRAWLKVPLVRVSEEMKEGDPWLWTSCQRDAVNLGCSTSSSRGGMGRFETNSAPWNGHTEWLNRITLASAPPLAIAPSADRTSTDLQVGQAQSEEGGQGRGPGAGCRSSSRAGRANRESADVVGRGCRMPV